MSTIDKRGSSSVELIYLLLFFLAFVALVQRFMVLAGRSHDLSVELQRAVEEKMVESGRPVCLYSEFDEHFAGGRVEGTFGNKKISKILTFATKPVCKRY